MPFEIVARINRMLERTAPSALMSVLAYDPDNSLYFHEDGCLGYTIKCYPMVGVDESRVEQLHVLLSQDFPADSLLQITLWTSPDIEDTLHVMNAIRERREDEKATFARDVSVSMVKARSEYLRKHTGTPPDEFAPALVRDIQVIISAKIPCQSPPNENDIERVCKLKVATVSILNALFMAPRVMDPEEYIRLIGSMVNWDQNASWRSPARIYDDSKMIRDQIFDPEALLRSQSGGVLLGKSAGNDVDALKCVRTLCVKRLPDYVHLARAAQYLGDLKRGQRGIREHCLITLNIKFPEAETARTAVNANKTRATWQMGGQLARFVPQIAQQKESFDLLFQALEGDRVVRAYLSFVLFADDEHSATAASSNMITYYRELGFLLQEDKFISVPVFMNALPMCAEAAVERNLNRYRTMAGRHATMLLPVIGEWKGTSTPINTMVTRNGQLFTFDLFDSETNFSAVVAAESGAGKSFFINFLLNNEQSLGSDVFLIEVGSSFKNICHVLKGDHLSFGATSTISINPFSIVEDYDEQSDLLMAVLLAMISPKGETTEYQIAQLRTIVKNLWDDYTTAGKSKNDLTIDVLAERLLAFRDLDDKLDSRINDLGVQLTPFRKGREYGRWFDRPASIQFNKSLTVLELQELKERPHLMKVVLVQLMAVIQRAMYLDGTNALKEGRRPKRKLLIIDEGWELITSGPEGKFIELGCRQLRKHRGGVVLILQSINDLYKTEVGEAIAENTSWKFLLQQKPEAIEALIEKKRLALGEGAAEVLKSIHTKRDHYSEVFVYSGNGAGIARLLVDRFTQVLYSTHADDRAAVAKRLAAGMPIEAAVRDVIEEQERRLQTGRKRNEPTTASTAA